MMMINVMVIMIMMELVVKMVTKMISSKDWSSSLPPPLTRGTDFLLIMMMMILVVMSMLVVMVVVLEMIILLRMIFEVDLGRSRDGGWGILYEGGWCFCLLCLQHCIWDMNKMIANILGFCKL